MKLYLQSFYFIFFLLATAGTCHSWNPFSSLSRWWNDRKAYKTYLSSDLDKTIDLLKKKQIDDPSHAETAYNLGVVLYKKGKYEEAAQQFDVASHLGALDDQLYLNSSINAGQCFFKQALSILGGEEWEKNCPSKEILLQSKEKALSAVSRYQLSLAREAAHPVATNKKEEAELLIQKIEDKLKEQEQKEKEKEKEKEEQDKQKDQNKDQNNQDNQKKDQSNSQNNNKDNTKENNGNNSSNEKQNPDQDSEKKEQNPSKQNENDPSRQKEEEENKEEKPNTPEQTPQQQQGDGEKENQDSEQKESSSSEQKMGEKNEPPSPQQPEQKSDAEKIDEEKEQPNEQSQNEESKETTSSPPEEKSGSSAPQNFKKRQMEAFLDQIEGKEKQAQKQRVRAMTGAAAHTPLMKGQKPW